MNVSKMYSQQPALPYTQNSVIRVDFQPALINFPESYLLLQNSIEEVVKFTVGGNAITNAIVDVYPMAGTADDEREIKLPTNLCNAVRLYRNGRDVFNLQNANVYDATGALFAYDIDQQQVQRYYAGYEIPADANIEGLYKVTPYRTLRNRGNKPSLRTQGSQRIGLNELLHGYDIPDCRQGSTQLEFSLDKTYAFTPAVRNPEMLYTIDVGVQQEDQDFTFERLGYPVEALMTFTTANGSTDCTWTTALTEQQLAEFPLGVGDRISWEGSPDNLTIAAITVDGFTLSDNANADAEGVQFSNACIPMAKTITVASTVEDCLDNKIKIGSTLGIVNGATLVDLHEWTVQNIYYAGQEEEVDYSVIFLNGPATGTGIVSGEDQFVMSGFYLSNTGPLARGTVASYLSADADALWVSCPVNIVAENMAAAVQTTIYSITEEGVAFADLLDITGGDVSNIFVTALGSNKCTLTQSYDRPMQLTQMSYNPVVWDLQTKDQQLRTSYRRIQTESTQSVALGAGQYVRASFLAPPGAICGTVVVLPQDALLSALKPNLQYFNQLDVMYGGVKSFYGRKISFTSSDLSQLLQVFVASYGATGNQLQNLITSKNEFNNQVATNAYNFPIIVPYLDPSLPRSFTVELKVGDDGMTHPVNIFCFFDILEDTIL